MENDKESIKEDNEGDTYVQKLMGLTKRESEILLLVAQQKMNAEIADELGLSQRTIENHRYRICKKLDLEGKGALTAWTEKVNLFEY